MLGSPFAGSRIFEGRLLLCRWLQPSQHQTHRAYQKHALTGVRALLVILAIAPIATQPGKGPLHHPPDGKGFERRCLRGRTADDHMPLPAAMLPQPLVVFMVAV